MPTSLEKTRKHISKKRNGVPTSLHEKSRDSLRLRAANVRDHRLEKLAQSRNKKQQPIMDRAAYFRENLIEKGGEALGTKDVQELIESFIEQWEEEHDEIKKARRPGRPATGREDLLKVKVEGLKTEYKNGFAIPDITSAEGAKKVYGWEGSWSYLTTMPWIKLNSAGQARPCEVPSKGLH